MNEDQEERLVVSFERIAEALSGIQNIAERASAKWFPVPKEPREAVLTRILTDEDRILEQQRAGDRPISEWANELYGDDPDGWIGERERAYIEEQKKNVGSQKSSKKGERAASPKKTRRKSRTAI